MAAWPRPGSQRVRTCLLHATAGGCRHPHWAPSIIIHCSWGIVGVRLLASTLGTSVANQRWLFGRGSHAQPPRTSWTPTHDLHCCALPASCARNLIEHTVHVVCPGGWLCLETLGASKGPPGDGCTGAHTPATRSMYATDEVSGTLYNASVSVQHVLCTTDEGRVCATTSSASTQSPGACSPKTVSTPLPPGRWWLGVHCQGGCALLGEAGARGGRALLGGAGARGGRAPLGGAGAEVGTRTSGSPSTASSAASASSTSWRREMKMERSRVAC
jgi:hypothetical protein